MKLMVAVLVVVAIIALWRGARKSSPTQTGESLQHSPNSIQLVSAQSAARRALCLASLVLRAKAEYQLHPAADDRPNANSTIDNDLVAKQETWMKKVGLWDAASPVERALMEKPFGSWTRQEVADSQWREEALAVLLWALKPDADLPPYDQPTFNAHIMTTVPHPSESGEFINKAKLREPREIASARDAAELWLWRARTTQIQRENVKPPKGLTFEKIIAMTADKAQQNGLFRAIDNDFPALNKSYAKLSESEWQTMSSISTERLYALNYLCGYAANWDDVPTGT